MRFLRGLITAVDWGQQGFFGAFFWFGKRSRTVLQHSITTTLHRYVHIVKLHMYISIAYSCYVGMRT